MPHAAPMGRATPLQKHRMILAAARKRFAYYGFAKVTMDEIASDVGLAKPSLYYYYPTKEHLFRAVIAHEQDQFFADMKNLVNHNLNAGTMLREYVGLRFRLFRELVNLNALGSTSWSEIQSISGDLFKNLERHELKTVEKVLKLGKAAGELLCENPRSTAKLLLHLLHGLRLRVFQGGEGRPIADAAYAELKRESILLMNIFVRSMHNQR